MASELNAFSLRDRERSMHFPSKRRCECTILDRLTRFLIGSMLLLVVIIVAVYGTSIDSLLSKRVDTREIPESYGVSSIIVEAPEFDFTGRWAYRSYHQVVDPAAGAADLIFARGIMEIFADPRTNKVSGMLRGADKNSGGKEWGLMLEGYQRFTNTSTVTVDPVTGSRTLVRSTIGELEMVGYGFNGTDAQGWVYEYRGTMILPWNQSMRADLTESDGGPVSIVNGKGDATTNPSGPAHGGGFVASSTTQQPTWTGSVIRRCCHAPIGLVAVATGTRINEGLTSNTKLNAERKANQRKSVAKPNLPVESILNQLVREESVNENVRIRRNYLQLSQVERDDYARGINELRKQPSRLADHELPDSLRFPEVRAKLNRLDDYVIIHQSHRALAHASPAFLPWHRVLLWQFEKDLQKALNNTNFSLPYWDWSDEKDRDKIWTKANLGSQNVKNLTLPWVLTYNGAATPTNATAVRVNWLVSDGPFADWDHYVGLNQSLVIGHGLQRCFGCDLPPPPPGGHAFMNTDIPPELPTIANVTATLNIAEYDRPPWNDAAHPSFRNAMEGWEEVGCSMHNAVHLWVGGHMRDVPIAPNDPVFWLHHAYVDKLWDLWQRKHDYTYTIHRGYLPDRRHDPNRVLQQPVISGSSAPGGTGGETKEQKARRIADELKSVRPGESYTLHPWLYAHDSAKGGTHRFDQMLPWNATIQHVLNPVNLGYVYHYDTFEDQYVWV